MGRSSLVDLVRNEGWLYAVARDGLFKLAPAGDATQAPRFQRVDGVDALLQAAASHTEGLLLAGDNGVLLMTEGRPFKQIYLFRTESKPWGWFVSSLPCETNGSVWELSRSKQEPDRFFLGTTSGLASIRFVDGNWIDEGTLPGFHEEVRSVVEEADGDLYISTLGSGFYHVKLQSGAHPIFEGASWKSLSDAHGYPSVAGVTHLVAWGNQLLFKTDDGAYRTTIATTPFRT